MIAYKLFREMKDGSIAPLFINKRLRLKLNEWLNAESHPTKGFVYRPGWHCTEKPIAPHLSEKGRACIELKLKILRDIICQSLKVELGYWRIELKY